MPKKKPYNIVPWWKIENLLMSTPQLFESGLYGGTGQLKLWINGRIRTR